MTLEIGPYDFDTNNRTGRVEVYRAVEGGGSRLVGSMPGDPTDEELKEMIRRLEAEVKHP